MNLHASHVEGNAIAFVDYHVSVDQDIPERQTDERWPSARVVGAPTTHPNGVIAVILAFNSEPYIRRSIESALAQQIDRPYSIWIHDDASTDGTSEIVEQYAIRHPDKVVAILQEVNQCSIGKRMRSLVYEEIKEGYIASLDGDDYWTNSQKLQIQCQRLVYGRNQ